MKGISTFFAQCKSYALLLAMITFNLIVLGQDVNKYSISGRLHYGFVMVHRPYMAIFNESHVPSVELSVAKKLTGNKTWHKQYLYPEVGISAMLIDLGNDELLGKGIGVSWFYNLPLINSKKIAYSLKVGQGFGWVEKKFDIESNYKNFANSTTINGFVYLNNILSFPVTPEFRPSIGLSFTHFSNGAYQKPNLGLNIPSVNIGFKYNIGKTEINQSPISIAPKISKWEYQVLLSGSKKERHPAENKNYAVVTVNLSSHKTKNLKSYWGYGIDAFYDGTTEIDLRSESNPSPSFGESMQIGIHGSYLLRAGKIYYVMQPGFYLYSKYKDDGILYHRIGTRYQILDNLSLNITLKTHFAVADHFEFGLAYKIR